MNFTREPIIETIISPKEGYKLSVRNSKISSHEEFIVEAIEVVSFGSALFYRSQERVRPFLLPVSDYEVLEVREARMVLKNASFEKNIKIGGGKENIRPHKETPELEEESSIEEAEANIITPAAHPEPRTQNDRKRDRRRRRRRPHDDRLETILRQHEPKASPMEEPELDKAEVKPNLPSFSGLIPPPPTLISETIGRYRDMQQGIKQETIAIQVEVAPEEPSFRKEDAEENTSNSDQE